MAYIEDINDSLLPEHRGMKWIGKWMREWKHDNKTLNHEAVLIIEARVNVLIDRFQVNVHEPYQLKDILNGLTKKYNGLIYEEGEEMMEIDLFNEDLKDDEERFLFGIGDTPIFNNYLYNNYPELLI